LGLVTSSKRTIGTKIYTTSYLYNGTGRVSQITYPSGRTVLEARNANGQVTGVTSKLNASAAAAASVFVCAIMSPRPNTGWFN
jgi:uncharacterized protein RhaS with RHS repeats